MSRVKKYTCEMCGIEFLSSKGSSTRTPKFCSKMCYQKSLLPEFKEIFSYRKPISHPTGLTPWNKLQRIERSCELCGTKYKTIRTDSRFCGGACYHKWQRTEDAKELHRPKAICQECGLEFYAHGRYAAKERKFCSKRCANRHKASLVKDKNLVTKNCAYCGQSFTVKYGARNQKYCSLQCRALDTIIYEDGDRVKSRNTARARRERLTIPLPKDYLEALLVIQNGACVYCGKQMGKSPTIDHILPVGRGGNNDRGNLIYCCKTCNSRKGSKPLSEFIERYGIVGAEERIFAYQHTAIQIEHLIKQ